jgi:ribonuclease VapC
LILDSSAIVAILLRERAHASLLERLSRDPQPGAGAPTLAESAIVLVARLGVGGQTLLARFVQGANVATVPFSEEHWQVAAQAFARFGKGRHPAALNYGDCMTYATARLAAEPLLCTGDDFAQTDLELA